jgi:plasmid stability protein
MSSITVRNLDESVKTGLKIRAARHGWSMEQEVRYILQNTLAAETGGAGSMSFAQRVNQRFKGLGLDELPLPVRQIARDVPHFDSP